MSKRRKKAEEVTEEVVEEPVFSEEVCEEGPYNVAEEGGCIVGFTELDTTGHIDCFFVHHQWQRRGIGTRLMERVVATAGKEQMPRLFAEVSITAAPFFREQGFVVVKENETIRRDVKLKQFSMERWLAA